jgi:fumarate reductase subunit C
VDWIKEMAQSAIDKAITPIKNGIQSYLTGITEFFSQAFLDYENNGEAYDKESYTESLLDLLDDYFLIIQILYLALLVIISISSPFLVAISALASTLFDLIATTIINAFGSPGSGFQEILDIANDGVDAIINYIGEIFGLHHVNPWYDAANNVNVGGTVILIIIGLIAAKLWGATLLDAVGLAIGILGIALSLWISIPGWDEWEESMLGLVLTGLGFAFSVLGKTPNQSLNIVLLIINGVCLITALVYTVGLGFANP